MNKYFLSLFLALTTLDMGIKQYIEDTFRKGEERSAKDSRLVIRRVHNKGFCLNAFDKYPVIVKGISAALCGMMGVQAFRLFQKRGRWVEKLGITILVAGAFSNTFDRICRGYVVDYFGIKIKNSKLAKITANLADIYVLGGILFLFAAKEKGVEHNGNTDKN